jgi:hypothetical protein
MWWCTVCRNLPQCGWTGVLLSWWNVQADRWSLIDVLLAQLIGVGCAERLKSQWARLHMSTVCGAGSDAPSVCSVS